MSARGHAASSRWLVVHLELVALTNLGNRGARLCLEEHPTPAALEAYAVECGIQDEGAAAVVDCFLDLYG